MYERFELLLKEYNVTSYKVAKETNVARSTLTNWKQGNYTPKMEKIQRIASYFHVSAEWLLGYDVPRNQFDINVELPDKDGLCNVKLTASDMQNLPKFIQYAIDLLEGDEEILVDGKPLNEDAKEKLKSALETSSGTIRDIFSNL